MAISVRHWYVLMFKQAFTKMKKNLSSLSIKRAYEGKGALEYFLPSMFMRVKQFGAGKYISRKMVISYVFIRETEGGIRLLKSKMPQLQLITSSESKAYNTQYVKLDDFEMTMVKKIADVYDGQLPCYRSDEYKLDGCDYVKVVDSCSDKCFILIYDSNVMLLGKDLRKSNTYLAAAYYDNVHNSSIYCPHDKIIVSIGRSSNIMNNVYKQTTRSIGVCCLPIHTEQTLFCGCAGQYNYSK